MIISAQTPSDKKTIQKFIELEMYSQWEDFLQKKNFIEKVEARNVVGDCLYLAERYTSKVFGVALNKSGETILAIHKSARLWFLHNTVKVVIHKEERLLELHVEIKDSKDIPHAFFIFIKLETEIRNLLMLSDIVYLAYFHVDVIGKVIFDKKPIAKINIEKET